MMMSEINDADRRLLVCVAVAMEPEPWGMGWGRGAAGPPSPLWGGQWKREVGRGCGGDMRSPRWEQRGPAAACCLLPPEAKDVWSGAQEVLLSGCQLRTLPFRAQGHLLPIASATFHSLSFLAQRDQGGDLFPSHHQLPLSLPPSPPRLLCAPELSSCHFNRIKASE